MNPGGNGLSVRLEILLVSHSILSRVTATWQASALHLIITYIFESVSKIYLRKRFDYHNFTRIIVLVLRLPLALQLRPRLSRTMLVRVDWHCTHFF